MARAALDALRALSCEQWTDAPLAVSGTVEEMAECQFAMGQLQALEALEYCTGGDADLARVVPFSEHWSPAATPDGATCATLSRFATLHVEHGEFVMESPVALATVVLSTRALPHLQMLATAGAVG